MDDAREIAGVLSEAQVRVVLGAFEAYASGVFPYQQVKPGGCTVALVQKGVIREKRTQTLTGRSKRCYALTPLGLQVRQVLQERQDG